jgi:hypothetical protein
VSGKILRRSLKELYLQKYHKLDDW